MTCRSSLTLSQLTIRAPRRGIVLGGEKKDDDKLSSYCAANLHLCFFPFAKSRFSHDAAHISLKAPCTIIFLRNIE